VASFGLVKATKQLETLRQVGVVDQENAADAVKLSRRCFLASLRWPELYEGCVIRELNKRCELDIKQVSPSETLAVSGRKRLTAGAYVDQNEVLSIMNQLTQCKCCQRHFYVDLEKLARGVSRWACPICAHVDDFATEQIATAQ
jgi:hypothetical protein